MKKEWEVKKLGEVCDFVRGPFGGSLKKSIFKPEGYAVYEQQHAIYDQFDDVRYFIDEKKFNEMKRFELNSGDLIMSCSGTMGKMAIIPENIKKGIINQALLKLTPSKKISAVFLKLWMQSDSFQESLKAYSQGAAIQNVASVKILKEIKMPVPSMNEQKRIVAVLDKAFSAISTAKANAEKNLQNARELFESYLQGVFANPGDGWEEKSLEEIGKITSSKRIYKREYVKEGIPFYRIKEIKELANGKNITVDLYISKSRYTEIKEVFGVPVEEDILMTAVGTIGEIYVVKKGEKFYFKDGNVLWFKDFNSIDSYFLKFALMVFVEKIKRLSIGSAYKALTIEKIEKHKIYVPPLPEQKSIVAKLNALSAETKKLEVIYQQKIADLEELKKSILQKAFNGELN